MARDRRCVRVTGTPAAASESAAAAQAESLAPRRTVPTGLRLDAGPPGRRAGARRAGGRGGSPAAGTVRACRSHGHGHRVIGPPP